MSDTAPKPQSKPQLRRMDGPPKPPTKVTLGLMDDGEPQPDYHPSYEMSEALTDVRRTWSELFMLKGKRPFKRESLELRLDQNIVLLGKALPGGQGKFVDMATDTLRVIRDYRLRHPRSDASDPKQAAQAKKVLDALA